MNEIHLTQSTKNLGEDHVYNNSDSLYIIMWQPLNS